MSRIVNKSVLAAPALCVLAMLGCDSKPAEPTKDPTPAASPQGAPTNPHAGMGSPGANPHAGMGAPGANPHAGMGGPGAGAAGGDISWTKPEAWAQVDNPSPMRKATYKVTKVDGDPEDAEMSVTQVGGSIDANIKRWEGQFEEGTPAKTSEKEVGGVKVTVVELSGTFKSGGGPMMGGSGESKKDWMMLAAIAHTEPAHFFKMTGPKKTVESARADFDTLVSSIAKK